MIVRFPDVGRLADLLLAGGVPAGIACRPVNVARDDDAIVVELRRAPGRAFRAAVVAHGGDIRIGDIPTGATRRASWYEAVPAVPDDDPVAPPRALFAIDTPAALVALAAELLRLGARQLTLMPFHGEPLWLAATSPPRFSLMRGGPVRSFVEQSPGVWVRAGFRYPLAASIPPPRDGWLFIDEVGHRRLPEMPPTGIPPTFALPRGPSAAEAPATVEVPVVGYFTTARKPSPPRLWVTHAGSKAPQLLAESLPEGILDRLEWAILESARGECVAFWVATVRPGTPTPSLAIDVPAFAPDVVPNFFVPAGRHIPLGIRREVFREAVGCGPAHLAWADDVGRHRAAAEAFTPLSAAVEYVVGRRAQVLPAWRPTEAFSPEPFAAPETTQAKGKSRGRGKSFVVMPTAPDIKIRRGEAPPLPPPAASPPAARRREVPKTRRGVLNRLEAAEGEFRSAEGPLDSPRRQALLSEMVELNAAAGRPADAAQCWLHAAWADDSLTADPWAVAENVSPEELADAAGRAAREDQPDPADLRAAALLLIAAGHEQLPALAPARAALERHEDRLSIRAAWLAWRAVSRSDGDALTLVRARDRLLHGLHETGLIGDRDMPTFLRVGGGSHRTAGPAGPEATRLLRLHAAARDWGGRHFVDGEVIDLLFAVGLARLKDLDSARALTPKPRRHEDWAITALRDRVSQVIDRRRGPLSAETMRRLSKLKSDNRVFADTARRRSRILEPHERVDPYRHEYAANAKPGSLDIHLAELADIGEATDYQSRFWELFDRHDGARSRFRLLCAGLPRGFAYGDAFALRMLREVAPVRDGYTGFLDVPGLRGWAGLLETALGLAGHYDRPSLFAEIVGRLRGLVDGLNPGQAAWLAGAMSGGLFRTLGRMGLREESADLFNALSGAVCRGEGVEAVFDRPGVNRAAVYPAMLRLAGGWFHFGDSARGEAALERGGMELFDPDQGQAVLPPLAEAYVAALGAAPADLAVPLFADMFERLDLQRCRNPNAMEVIDSAVLTLAAEDFGLNEDARRLLDEDEYLIRRRIHADVRAALGE